MAAFFIHLVEDIDRCQQVIVAFAIRFRLELQVFKQGWRELTDIAVPCHYPVKSIVVLAIQI